MNTFRFVDLLNEDAPVFRAAVVRRCTLCGADPTTPCCDLQGKRLDPKQVHFERATKAGWGMQP